MLDRTSSRGARVEVKVTSLHGILSLRMLYTVRAQRQGNIPNIVDQTLSPLG